jgi:HK97 gp10 family phage protein
LPQCMGLEMADSISIKIEGIDDLKRVLSEIPDRLKKKHLLSALRKAARVPLSAAKQEVPVMTAENAAKAPYRTSGLLKKRLMVRTSKAARKSGNVGVFINIKPLKTAAIRGFKRIGGKSSQNPIDPFYWKFVQFGTKKMPARDFMGKAADALPDALEVFKREISPLIQWWNNRK